MVHPGGLRRKGARGAGGNRPRSGVAHDRPADDSGQDVFHRRRQWTDRPWFGRVWLNPPYSRALLSPFIDKLVSEYTRGAVDQAILLTHNYTDTEWFHAAARAAQTICFPRGRIRFLSPAGDECSPTQGQALFYFGIDDTAFRRTFADVGLIARAA